MTIKFDEAMRSYYAFRAPEYDRVYELPERQGNLKNLKDWIPKVLSKRRVLEVACGTGYWTQFFAPVSQHVMATDASIETIEIAKKRLGTNNVKFEIVDAYSIPDTLGQFDAAFAGFWISHVPQSRLQAFLTNLHRRMQPGSTVLFIDNEYVEGSNHPITEQDDEGNTYQTRKLLDGTFHRVLKNFPSENDLINMIDGLGVKPEYRKLDYYWTFQYITN